MRLSRLLAAVQLLGLPLSDGLAPDIEQDFVVIHVAYKAGDPEGDARPEARRGLRAAQVRRGGGGREEGREEEAVRHVERDGARDDDDVRFGAGGGAEGRDERAVEVVREIERGEDGLGAEAEGGAGEGGQREGCERKRVEVRREEEGERRGELHHDPGLDAVDGEGAVGCGEPAERRIVHESNGAEQGETAEEPLFGHCVCVVTVGFSGSYVAIRASGVPVYRYSKSNCFTRARYAAIAITAIVNAVLNAPAQFGAKQNRSLLSTYVPSVAD